ncbi:hypothetical protein [Halanaerobacter jeridensis]|uniref:Uncharacterized protein n=1 Tax=Halanaerobacter jeridensis TaxID=706427 RepID=A0A938XUH5_9FIRM|nr:hypothetical protein [Halanaerobacter jeridensis]MBM7558134.1 hypothetical protein [Halanaerobacter jeridensis]
MSHSEVLDSLNVEIISPKDESRFVYINDYDVVNLCAFLLNNKDFLVYAGSILSKCTSINDLDMHLEQFYLENYGDDLSDKEIENNNKFVQLIHALYSNNSEESELGKIRGAILERLALLLILNRYMYIEDENHFFLPIKTDRLSEGCQLNVDCKVKWHNRNWTTNNPIDVAGWDQNELVGEFYECKVKIRNIKSSDEEILYKIADICDTSPDINNYNVGIVTFSNTMGVKYYFKYLDENKSDKVHIYGRDNISQLLNCN